ncbi:MAG: TIGR03086 family protein [Acidimicrobiales bacterium]|nr:TIGR03086 family protein [Acidimicrobiales bacterium]
MSQAAERYQLIAGAFDARVQAAPPDTWNDQSPCTEWKARDVVAHVVDNHRRLIAEVAGTEPKPMTAEEDPKAAWTSAYATMRQLTEDPGAMAHSVHGPMGEMPLEQMLPQFVCMDMLVHTWDLARAVGGDERLNQEAVREAYETVKPMDAMIRQPNVFGPKLDPPPGADVQTEFLYFLGRRA